MENIRTEGKSNNKEKINKFIKLSKDYYRFIDKKEEYPRRKWIDKNI